MERLWSRADANAMVRKGSREDLGLPLLAATFVLTALAIHRVHAAKVARQVARRPVRQPLNDRITARAGRSRAESALGTCAIRRALSRDLMSQLSNPLKEAAQAWPRAESASSVELAAKFANTVLLRAQANAHACLQEVFAGRCHDRVMTPSLEAVVSTATPESHGGKRI